ncbi:MAG TPA: hypothetical protein VGP97_09260 [Burkholderiales bacterium]|jgi:hypothetical protein|nr:hypothetical protein [Burkholderiales bacterium]
MEELLRNPWIQGGLAPLLAGIAAALVFYPLRVSGLAAAFGFFAAVYLTGQLEFEKKLFLLAAAAALLGALVDVAFRPTRKAGLVLGLVFGIAACWIFIFLIGRMPAQRIALYAMGLGALVAASVAFSVLSYDEPPRAAAAGMGLGLATGAMAFLGGSEMLALWSFGLAAGAAGFLLVALVLARGIVAGASFTLSVGVIGGTLAATVTLQRGLRWYEAALFALVPLAVRLPVPHRSAIAQAIVALVYALAVGGGACALVWMR